MNISFDNISKKYGKKTAIVNFNEQFCHGEVTALLGPSGCGKTTLLNMLAGIIEPTDGTIYFDGIKVDQSLLEQYNIGYVFQNYSLYPNMTVSKNISFPLSNMKFANMQKKERKQHIDQKVHEIATMLKIEDLLDRYPSELSGGQQQRVAIGRALVKNPDILLMDEPFANLDKKLAIELRDEIRNIQQDLGITLIFVTHNQNDAAMISDKVILLNNGRVQQAGKAEELYAYPCNQFVAEFMGEVGLNVINISSLNSDPAFNKFKVDCMRVNSIAFRPEHIIINCCLDKDFSGFWVHNVVCNGHYFTVFLKSKSGICIKAFTNKPFEIDQKVTIDVEKMLLFDSNGALVQL